MSRWVFRGVKFMGIIYLAINIIKATIRQASIEEALQCVILANDSITLNTDGGPENNFKSFVGLSYPIEHRKALVDVHFSNSLIEAHNKIIKYNYLY